MWMAMLQTRASGWTILIRALVGLVVFFPEGIQKLATFVWQEAVPSVY